MCYMHAEAFWEGDGEETNEQGRASEILQGIKTIKRDAMCKQKKSQKWIKSGYVTQSWKCHALYMWRGEHGQRDAITCWPAVRVISPPLGPADPGRTGASPSGEAPARETLWPPAITCRLTDISRHSPRRSDQPNDPGSIPLSEFASAIGETNFGPSTKKRGSEIKFTPCKNQRVGFRGSAAKNAVL